MKKTRILPFGIEAIICSSLFSKAKGMIFSTKVEKTKPLLFVFSDEQYVPIHMFFVFFPLIVIWIDKEKRIMEFKILNPFSMHSPKRKSKYILEIPFIEGQNTKSIVKRLRIGMQLKFRG